MVGNGSGAGVSREDGPSESVTKASSPSISSNAISFAALLDALIACVPTLGLTDVRLPVETAVSLSLLAALSLSLSLNHSSASIISLLIFNAGGSTVRSLVALISCSSVSLRDDDGVKGCVSSADCA